MRYTSNIRVHFYNLNMFFFFSLTFRSLCICFFFVKFTPRVFLSGFGQRRTVGSATGCRRSFRRADGHNICETRPRTRSGVRGGTEYRRPYNQRQRRNGGRQVVRSRRATNPTDAMLSLLARGAHGK